MTASPVSGNAGDLVVARFDRPPRDHGDRWLVGLGKSTERVLDDAVLERVKGDDG